MLTIIDEIEFKNGLQLSYIEFPKANGATDTFRCFVGIDAERHRELKQIVKNGKELTPADIDQNEILLILDVDETKDQKMDSAKEYFDTYFANANGFRKF